MANGLARGRSSFTSLNRVRFQLNSYVLLRVNRLGHTHNTRRLRYCLQHPSAIPATHTRAPYPPHPSKPLATRHILSAYTRANHPSHTHTFRARASGCSAARVR
eukprot:3203014-Pyramimonas_sp.AAC.1